MPLTPLDAFLRDVNAVHQSGAGVRETSYYPALSNLLNDVGNVLRPAVRCLTQLRNIGAGMPDGGLFTTQQLRGNAVTSWDGTGPTPERGALEVKSPADDVTLAAMSAQVRGYLETYGLVMVTNLRDFALVHRNGQGDPEVLERFMLAASEVEFWALAAHPQRVARDLEERFVEYLRRVMLAKAELTSPKQVAWFLASYARDARARIEHANLQALTAVRTALESSLGLTFEGERGDRFFRSTLIQTLFYGLFSAWVLWCRTHAGDEDFDWKDAQWSLHVPMIRALFEQVSQPGKLLPLHLVEPLDWAAGVLNRVDRAQFFTTFSEERAVQYFYEPFLEEFDPVLRKDLGVWYTPDEIVRYQVERVDHVLRTELDIPRGLADSRVVVLDPCCGTGTYLVEVLRRIKHTLDDEGTDALSVQNVKAAAMTRIHGFEIMPAPFVVAHLQLGLLLTSMGAPLQSEERVGVYLTNSLTGWSPSPSGVHERTREELLFPEMTDERDAARHIKQEEQILVVLGNPPYNAFAGVHAEEEGDLVDCYKDDLNTTVQDGGWGIRKFNLDDLYVRFFRIAERRITEGQPGRGIVSYISNYSYLGDPSFVVMRKRLHGEFDAMWFDNMNGDSRATGKRTPDGSPDPSVFSTEYHNVGIKVGTAIATLVRTSPRRQAPTVCYRDFWGVSKRQDLLECITGGVNPDYLTALPSIANKFSFRPSGDTSTYDTWPKVTELAQEAPLNGPVERRAMALIDLDHNALAYRMQKYFSPAVSDEKIASIYQSLMMTDNRLVGQLFATRSNPWMSGGATWITSDLCSVSLVRGSSHRAMFRRTSTFCLAILQTRVRKVHRVACPDSYATTTSFPAIRVTSQFCGLTSPYGRAMISVVFSLSRQGPITESLLTSQLRSGPIWLRWTSLMWMATLRLPGSFGCTLLPLGSRPPTWTRMPMAFARTGHAFRCRQHANSWNRLLYWVGVPPRCWTLSHR
jgi:hypothetical protein